MANFINFDAKVRFVDLKATFDLATALKERVTTLSFTPTPVRNAEAYQQFIDKVVNTVKKTYLTATEGTCCISLENEPHPPSPNLSTPHLVIVAQALYRSFGIEIKQVDAMSSPRKMVVTWHRDHAMFNPPSLGLIKYRKNFTDCTLKFGNQLFPAHRMILAIKSSYFEKAFKNEWKESAPGAIINIAMEHLEERSIEILLDYFYMGELHLEGSSITQIDNLVNLSSYFVLPHLEQMCFEHMCKHVNADNLPAFYELAKHYEHEELKSALLHHVRKEVTPDNIASLISLARTEKIEGLEGEFLLDIGHQVVKIDYYSCTEENNRVNDFAKFLDIAIQYQSVPILDVCVKQMKGICDNKSLPTLIAYLALTSQYSSCFEWMPESRRSHFQTLQKNFHKKVLEWFKTIIWRATHLSISDSPAWDLVEEGLTTAITHNLQEIKIACEDVLISWISKNKDRDKIAVIANQFSLTRVVEACQKQAAENH